MDMEQLKHYVRLEKREDDLNRELKLVKTQIAEMREVLVPQFLSAKMKRTTIDGHTVSIVRDVKQAMVNDRHATVEALRQSGLAEFVGVNHQGLRGYVKELLAEAEEVLRRENAGKPPEEQRILCEDDVAALLPEPLRNELRIALSHTLRCSKE